MFPGIIQQAVMPADHRDSRSLPKRGAEIPVLTAHKSFPDQLLVWAQRQLLQLASLMSSPQQTVPSQVNVPACSDSSKVPNADVHHTAQMCYLASWFFKEITVFVYVQCDSAAAWDIDACKYYAGGTQHPSSPGIPLPQVLPPTFSSDVPSPISIALLTTHLILCRLSWNLFFQILVLLKGIML